MSNIKLGKFPSTRLRRLRMKDFTRRMISENNLSVNDLIWPIFVCEGNNIADEIKSLTERLFSLIILREKSFMRSLLNRVVGNCPILKSDILINRRKRFFF